MPRPDSTPLSTGLLVLHGQRAEDLADTVFVWLARHPLAPLEEEVFLVQSNGMAEWLKMTLAAHPSAGGICAASRVELPARFLWRSYRQTLGRQAVPAESPLDKTPLTWRLMQQLPALLADETLAGVLAPVAGFLAHGGADRQLQLCRRLADLFDQYQVYRSDWLAAWAAGEDVLIQPTGRLPVPPDQRWQPALWRALLAPLDPVAQAALRPVVHQQVVARLLSDEATASPLPRRVVLFGMTHLPLPALQVLTALAERSQVLMAVPNPCRFHWADIIDGRELLQMQRRRQPLRAGQDLAAVPLAQMHAHGHPLLAAWGRQGRDFIRQLDAFDDVQRAQARFELPRLDLFEEDPATHSPLLQRVQARIRDLVPLAEHDEAPLARDDRSIVFHSAHSPVRELEVLHDQLLSLLAEPAPAGGRPLQPRDIVVMVPDIEPLAPAIRAVFGQYPRHDPRHIPFDLTDLGARRVSPVVAALDWLLRLPQQRCRLSELRDLLDVPALARRLGLVADDLPRLVQWMQGAGWRWGLDEAHRADLGLAPCGPANSGWWALRRMLLGYASGGVGEAAPAPAFAGIEPYGEVAGLEAELAGGLAQLLERLSHWWAVLRQPATPVAWAARGRQLLGDFFAAGDDEERQLMAALSEALDTWLRACDQAGFDAEVPLDVAREAWLDALDEPSLNRRFRAGGVTFCTLMPMRAIPFEVVCLLGMNDGDYPRRAPRSDFDLMALPGQARPGDRARRDDDRQLMLEALLSARRVLYLSWTGRHARDNSEQPPSVLISQLRDYLAAAWGPEAVQARTKSHPLQPFSRRYFEGPEENRDETRDDASTPSPAWFTWAREWRSAHARDESAAVTPEPAALPVFEPDPRLPLGLEALIQFLGQPVRAYFRQRLGVVFDDAEAAWPDDEPFDVGGLAGWTLVDELLQEVLGTLKVQMQRSQRGPAALSAELSGGTDGSPAQIDALVAAGVARLRRSGRFPLGRFGERTEAEFGRELGWMLRAWAEWQRLHPEPAPRQGLSLAGTPPTLRLEDWLDDLHAPADGDALALPVWLQVQPGKLCQPSKAGKAAKATKAGKAASKSADEGEPPAPRLDKLLPAFVRLTLAAASDQAVQAVLIGRDATLQLTPPEHESAREVAQTWLSGWLAGQQAPLPLALRTGLALLDDEPSARAVFEGGYQSPHGERDDPALARLFEDYEALRDHPPVGLAGGPALDFAGWAQALYGPLRDWVAAGHVSVTVHAQTEVPSPFDDGPAGEELKASA